MSSVPSGFVAWSDVSSRQRTERKMSLDRNGRVPTGGDVSARMANRKRKHDVVVVDHTNPSTSKRPRSIHPQHFNLASLPSDKRVRQAATLLGLPVTRLRSVISDLEEEEPEQEPEQFVPYHDWLLSHQPPRIKRAMGRGRNTPRPGSTGSMGEKAVGGEMNNYTGGQGEKSVQQWNGQLDGPSEFPEPASQSGRDSTFCFPKEVFVDFFSNWCSVDDEPSRGNGYENQSMLPPASATAPQFVGAQFMDSYPQNYGTSMTSLPFAYDSGGHNSFAMESSFSCDTPEFSGPWMQPPQQYQVQTQPHKQEMTYLQPPSYSESNLSFANSNGYLEAPPPDSGFVSDASLSQQKSETRHGSDSGHSVEDAESSLAGVPTRRGPFKSQYDRDQTAETRKNGCCLRCRHQKIRCIPDPTDPKGVCLTCKNVKAANMKVQKPACTRHRITDVRLYKMGQVPGLEWSQRWSNRTLKEMGVWATGETITIQVSEGYTSTPLKLVVSKFKPVKGDVLERSWVSSAGVKKKVAIPSYAIKDLAAARDAYRNYINQGGPEFFQGALDPKDRFLWMTYNMAITTSNDSDVPTPQRNLLRMVLQLWVAIRLNTKSTNIVGPETLGMPPDIFDATHPTPGRIPIPPVMGNQIELILSRDIQDPLRNDILDALQKLIYSNKPGCWFTIYLCTFILLHNCSMITKHDSTYARKHGLQARFARPAMVAEYHAGAMALLAHFHLCNKGSYPFSAAAGERADILTNAGLTEKQSKFIESTRKFVNGNAVRFEEFRWAEAFDNDYYFISQLYEQDWKPRIKI
ncbi:hypothetical protein VE02_05374 [Pseudogymnoascus sp. 03VT05]|nr:hypothetical protein VE02_05374 [Pseudogymnoascus sp. 03VT05]